MTIQVRKGGAWRTITAAYVFAGGAWRSLVTVKVFKGGAWRTVANFTAPPSPPTGGGGGGGGGTITVTISPNPFAAVNTIGTPKVQLTATPSGGLAPYTYAWTVVTSSQATTLNSPTTAITNVSQTGDGTATVRCTATDSLGTTAHADASGTFTT